MPRITTRNIPYSLNFDGSGDYVTVNDAAEIRAGTGDCSWVWWFKARRTGALNYMMAKIVNTAGTGPDFLLAADGTINFVLYNAAGADGSITSAQNATKLDDFKWHHCVVTRDDSVMTVYIDGALFGTNSGLAAGVNLDDGAVLRIGGRTTTLVFNGLMTGVQFYQGLALSATQASTLYYEGINPQAPTENWGFTEGTGTTLAGTVNNGTITNATWNPDAPIKLRKSIRNFPYGLVFSSATTTAVTGTPTNPPTTAMSFACWIRYNAFNTNFPNLINLDWDSVGAMVCFRGRAADAYTFALHFTDATYTLTSKVYPRDNNWHHVVCTWGSSTMRLYVDGHIDPTTVSTAAESTPVLDIAALRMSQAAAGSFLEGNIADWKLWRVGLTTAEVEDLYYKNITPQSASLTADYQMTEGSGNSVADQSGNNNTLTLSSVNWVTTTPFKTRTTVQRT